jgi:hypothetical protein
MAVRRVVVEFDVDTDMHGDEGDDVDCVALMKDTMRGVADWPWGSDPDEPDAAWTEPKRRHGRRRPAGASRC